MAALFFAAAFSQYYRKEIRIPPSFELVSITTVVVGMTHGPLAGAVFGGVAGLAAEILS
ncbi:MAG: hypothetical protein HYU35_00670, partial [Parcubacteria group bacterium]|nr:hypothetical protein [Parcubacteria group bacterium]